MTDPLFDVNDERTFKQQFVIQFFAAMVIETKHGGVTHDMEVGFDLFRSDCTDPDCICGDCDFLRRKDNFLKVARRVADFVHAKYSDPQADPMLANCPVNPSIIMGAVELYRMTGEERYLELANIIINNRGKKRGGIGRTARRRSGRRRPAT